MNIAELLKKALADADWTSVSEAYYMLSGERMIEPGETDVFSMFTSIMNKLDDVMESKPEKKPRTPAKKKSRTSVKKKPEVDNDFSIRSNKPSRSIADRQFENKFETMNDVIAEAERESGYDKINDNIKPTSRSRKSYKTKTVKCIECSKSSDVNPVFAKENYICDNCLQRRGR